MTKIKRQARQCAQGNGCNGRTACVAYMQTHTDTHARIISFNNDTAVRCIKLSFLIEEPCCECVVAAH